MSFELDKKQKVKEILKCGKDPAYFLKTYKINLSNLKTVNKITLCSNTNF